MRYLNIREVGQMLGVSTDTLQRWERIGRLVPATRSITNRRLYSSDQIRALQGRRITGGTYGYARAGSGPNSQSVLDSQIALLRAVGVPGDKIFRDIAPGAQGLRPGFCALTDCIESGEASIVHIPYPSTLTAHGYDWFERYADRHGCEIHAIHPNTGDARDRMFDEFLAWAHEIVSARNFRRHARADTVTVGEKTDG